MTRPILAALLPLALAACAAPRQPVPVTPAIAPARIAPATAPGDHFLLRNAAQPGVVRTPSGVQYFVVRSGPPGGRLPGTDDVVRFFYEGKLTTGETFDSKVEGSDEPLEGAVRRFVPGFQEALTRMRAGDEFVVWIPAKLGYGDRALPGIPAGSILRFHLKLVGIGPSA